MRLDLDFMLKVSGVMTVIGLGILALALAASLGSAEAVVEMFGSIRNVSVSGLAILLLGAIIRVAIRNS